MKDIAIDCILAAKKDINQKQRRFNFELLGFDFLIDEDFRTWLLEVNNNPYLGY
jgi:D-alanine-D-alanine ligase-like ATP-grasp enzyme